MSPKKAAQHMEVARAYAKFSKDQSTKVGAVIVGTKGETRAQGYNGAPRGSRADEDERGTTRPEKYYWFSHAELNAITNAARVGTPLEGSTIVITHPPCMDCARAIVQAGIVEVIAAIPSDEFCERWKEHGWRAIQLFDECGVRYREI